MPSVSSTLTTLLGPPLLAFALFVAVGVHAALPLQTDLYTAASPAAARAHFISYAAGLAAPYFTNGLLALTFPRWATTWLVLGGLSMALVAYGFYASPKSIGGSISTGFLLMLVYCPAAIGLLSCATWAGRRAWSRARR